MTIQEFLALVSSSRWEILACFLSIIALWQGVRASRYARLLAKHEGAFDHPNLELGLFGQTEASHIVILAPLNAAPLSFPIPISVRNVGSASARDVQIIVSGNESLLPYSREWLEREQPDASGVVSASFLGKTGHVNTVSFQIAHVHPGTPLNLIQTSILDLTSSFTSDVPITTADKKALTMRLDVRFTYRLDVVIFQENGEPIASAFRVNVFDVGARSNGEALEEFWRKFSLPKRKKRRLFGLLHNAPVQTLCVATIDEANVGRERLEEEREVPVEAVRLAMGLLTDDGLFVPALGVALGSYEGALADSPPLSSK